MLFIIFLCKQKLVAGEYWNNVRVQLSADAKSEILVNHIYNLGSVQVLIARNVYMLNYFIMITDVQDISDVKTLIHTILYIYVSR